MLQCVDAAATTALHRCLPQLKAVWTELLRQEPALNPLGRPDILVFMMDETLRQLTAEMNAPKSIRAHVPMDPPHRHCRCGLNPLLNYFATGELALRESAATALGSDFETTLTLFQDLARREIDSICSVCQLAHRPACAVRFVNTTP